MADNKQYTVSINVTDSGTADTVKAKVKDLSNALSDLKSKAGGAASGMKDFAASGKDASSAVGTTVTSTETATKAMDHFSLSTTGARRELIVLAHEASQGNWTKFGGSLMVLAERMDVLPLLMSPIGIGIGVLAGGAALAAYNFEKATVKLAEFNGALAITGNAAGHSAQAIIDAADATGKLNGHTDQTTEAFLKLAQSGQYSFDQIKQMGPMIVDMANMSGEKVDSLVAKFIKIGEDPVRAAKDLEKQYNFLSAAEYAYIVQLDEEGRKEEAAARLQGDLSAAMKERANETNVHLSTMARFAEATRNAFTNMWKALSGNGTLAQDIAGAQSRVDFMAKQVAIAKSNGGTGQAENNALNSAKAELANLQAQAKSIADDQHRNDSKVADNQQTQKDGQAAVDYVNNIMKRAKAVDTLTEALKKNHAEFAAGRLADPTNKNFSQTNEDEAAAYLKKSMTPAVHKASSKPFNDSVQTQIDAIQGQIEAERIALKGALLDADAEYAAGNESYADYVSKKEKLRADELNGEITHIQQIEGLAKKKVDVGGMQNQRYVNMENDAKEKIKEVHQQANKDLVEFNAKQKAADDAFLQHQTTALNALTENAIKFNRSQDAGNTNKLNQFFMTDQERADAQQLLTVTDHYSTLMEQAQADLQKGIITQDSYNAKIKELLGLRDQQIQKTQDVTAAEKAMRTDMAAGVESAYRQWAETAANTYQQVKDLTKQTFDGITDNLASMLVTGKANWSSFLQNIATGIAKMGINQMMKPIFQEASSWLSSVLGTSVGAKADGSKTNPFYTVSAGLSTDDPLGIKKTVEANGDTFFDKLKGGFGNIVDSIGNGFMNIFNSLGNGLSSILSTLGSIITSIGASSGSGGFLGMLGGLFGGSGGGSDAVTMAGDELTFMATGTNNVPYDNFPAMLHKGEAVVPAAYNPAVGGQGQGGGMVFAPIININNQGDMGKAQDQQALATLITNMMNKQFNENMKKAARPGGSLNSTSMRI